MRSGRRHPPTRNRDLRDADVRAEEDNRVPFAASAPPPEESNSEHRRRLREGTPRQL